MAEGESRRAWAHTAALLAMIANVHRDPKRDRVFRPADFNPHGADEKAEPRSAPPKVGIGVLKQVFVGPAPGQGK